MKSKHNEFVKEIKLETCNAQILDVHLKYHEIDDGEYSCNDSQDTADLVFKKSITSPCQEKVSTKLTIMKALNK